MSAGWKVRRIGTEGWYEIEHPTIPVLIQVQEGRRVDMEEWGENVIGLDILVCEVAETIAHMMDVASRLGSQQKGGGE